MERRTFLRAAGLTALGMAATSCLPIKYLTGAIDQDVKTRTTFADETALCFASTVIPTHGEIDPRVIDPLWDRYYPFHQFCPLFLDLLHSTSDDLFARSFIKCSVEQREKVIDHLLASGGQKQQLVTGAIYAIQCTHYAGAYDPDAGCPDIGFLGTSGIGAGLPPIKPGIKVPRSFSERRSN